MASLRIRAALGPVLVTMFLAGPAATAASAQDISDYEVKAAMLVQFSKFVEWPADRLPAPATPFVIGVMGDDPFGDILDRIVKGQAVGGHAITIRRYKTIKDLDGAPHLLFVSDSEESQLSKLAEHLSGAGTLIVGDFRRFAQQGGTIGFVRDGDRIAFEINIGAADRCRLKISSRLLALARKTVTTSS